MQTLKVVVVGNVSGKTCFIKTWVTNSFPDEFVPTVFDNYEKIHMVNGTPVEICFWDTSGQEDYDRLRPLSYPGTDVFLLCYDITRWDTFKNLSEKWLPEVRHFCPDTLPIILLGLQADLKNSDYLKTRGYQSVTYDEACTLAREEGLAGIFEASSLNHQGLEETMSAVIAVGLASQAQKKRGFNLLKKRKPKTHTHFLTVDDPPPPNLPLKTKAPHINIVTSTWSDDWNKIVNQADFSDMMFHLGAKEFHAHKYILCIASDVLRILLGVGGGVKSKGLSQCAKWTANRLKHLSTDTVNEGKEEGFISMVTENKSSSASDQPTVHITLDPTHFTELAFKRCLEFLYTSIVSLNQESEGLDEIIRAAELLNLPELVELCENARKGDEILNPSIGKRLIDRNSAIGKKMFFNRPLLSDVKFLVEGRRVYAHKLVLATRCDVLGAMLTGGFAESNAQEIELPKVLFDDFMALLEYLYTDHSPIEKGDSVGIMVLANQYVLPRLMSLCELYITKVVDRACAKSIADADIDIIGLLLTAQLHNAQQLSGWCLHFIASNYLDFEHKDNFSLLTGDNRTHVEQHRWPPVSYFEAMEEYRDKHGSDAQNGQKEKCRLM